MAHSKAWLEAMPSHNIALPQCLWSAAPVGLSRRELTQQNEDGQEAKMLIRIFEDLAQDFGLKFAFFGAVKVFLILSLIAGDASFVVYVIFRLGVALWLGMLVIALFNLVVGIIFLVIATKYKSWEDRKKRREHARNVHRQVIIGGVAQLREERMHPATSRWERDRNRTDGRHQEHNLLSSPLRRSALSRT